MAYETKGMIDDFWFLSVEKPLNLRNQQVRVLVLLPESDDNIEWVKATASSPSFDFLNDEAENIYTLHDGTAIEK